MTTSRPRKAAAKAAAPAPQETGADILGRVKPKRRRETADICLNASLIADFQREDERLNELKLQVNVSNRMNPGAEVMAESDEYVAQAKAVRKIEQAIKASMVTFTFESMNKDEWRALLDNNPPRPGDRMDAVLGYDRDTVLDLLVRRSLVSPEFADCDVDGCDHEDCGTWQQLMEIINPAEWGELRDAANLANSAVVDAPFSRLASQTLDKRASGSR